MEVNIEISYSTIFVQYSNPRIFVDFHVTSIDFRAFSIHFLRSTISTSFSTINVDSSNEDFLSLKF